MGEIKFRAWDKDREMFLEPSNLIVSNGDIFESFRDLEDGTPERNSVLIQYTGLKDKNGVEIYEGDCFEKVFKMIEIPTGRTFEQTEVGVVKFDDGQFTCHISGWGHATLKDVLGYQNKNNDYWKNGLIIGNIYENPELLEVQNG